MKRPPPAVVTDQRHGQRPGGPGHRRAASAVTKVRPRQQRADGGHVQRSGQPESGQPEDAGDYSGHDQLGRRQPTAPARSSNSDGTFSVTAATPTRATTIGGESMKAAARTHHGHDQPRRHRPAVVTDHATVSDPDGRPPAGPSVTAVTEGRPRQQRPDGGHVQRSGQPTGRPKTPATTRATDQLGRRQPASAGTIVNNSDGTFSVYGSHTYAGDSDRRRSSEGTAATTSRSRSATSATDPRWSTDHATVSDPNVAATGGSDVQP